MIHSNEIFRDQQSMSEQQLKAFLAKVQADSSLQEQLKVEGADVIAIAKADGFSITTEEKSKHIAKTCLMMSWRVSLVVVGRLCGGVRLPVEGVRVSALVSLSAWIDA